MQTDLYALSNFYQKYDTSLLNAFYKLLEKDNRVTINKVTLDLLTGAIKALQYSIAFSNIYGSITLYINMELSDDYKTLNIYFSQGFNSSQPINKQPGGTWSDSDGTNYYWSINTNYFSSSAQNFNPNKGFIEPVQCEISESAHSLFFNSYIPGQLEDFKQYPYAIVFNNSIIITTFQPAGTNGLGILILANWTQYSSINRKALVLFNGDWYSETQYDNAVFHNKTVTPYNLLSDFSTSSVAIASSPLVLKGTYVDTSDGTTKTFHIGHTDLHFTVFHNEKASQTGGNSLDLLTQRARNFIYYYGPKKYHIASTWFKKTDDSINDCSVKITEPTIHQVEYQYF